MLNPKHDWLNTEEIKRKLTALKKTRLRSFVILSLVLHVLLIAALIAVFLPKRRILGTAQDSYPVGILVRGGGIDNAKHGSSDSVTPAISRGSDNSINVQPDNAHTSQEESHTKSSDKSRPSKHVSKANQSERHHFDGDISNRDTGNMFKAVLESGENEIALGNKGLIASGGENAKPETGTDSLGQKIEAAFPDYKENPKPRYPMIARKRGYEGSVLLRVWVLESGTVGKVELEKSSGYEMLDEAALKAVENWVFIPGEKNGQPVRSWVTVPIKFQLDSG